VAKQLEATQPATAELEATPPATEHSPVFEQLEATEQSAAASSIELETRVDAFVELMLERKAEEVVTLDLRGISAFTDSFLIATTETTRQAKALLEDLYGKAKELGMRVRGVEGAEDGRWILFDLNEIVIHLFTPRFRQFYDLESFWGQAAKKVYL